LLASWVIIWASKIYGIETAGREYIIVLAIFYLIYEFGVSLLQYLIIIDGQGLETFNFLGDNFGTEFLLCVYTLTFYITVSFGLLIADTVHP
jgi:hypothetical protein